MGRHPALKPKELAGGKVDAFLGCPPQPQNCAEQAWPCDPQRHGTNRGPSISAACCRQQRLRGRYPVATKRVMRATLKAVDLCTAAPAQAAIGRGVLQPLR